MPVIITQHNKGITIRGFPDLTSDSGICALLEGDDQKAVVEWFWKNKPEIFAEVMGNQTERLNRFMKIEAEKEQRWFLNWIKKNNPALCKEIFEL